MSEAAAGLRGSLGLDEALRMIEGSAPKPVIEMVGLASALGRVLAQELRALLDQPPFDKSTMDGYAPAASFPAPEGPWRVAGTVAAGDPQPAPLEAGDCLRIMTGAPLPPGSLCVQRVEWSEILPDSSGGAELVRFTRQEISDNIVRRGANQRSGASLLGPRLLAPQDIGILASSGYAEVPVARRPRAIVISTGDELSAAGAALGVAGIYDSNGPQLCAQAQALGCESSFMGIVGDDEEALAAAFASALAQADILLVSGGVSMGDFDHVPRALARAGVETLFHGLAMKPGKPVFFGRATPRAAGREGHTGGEACGTAVFGLPGNPVSTFVVFEVLVRAYLGVMLGLPQGPRLIGARLASPLSRSESERHEFLPARLGRGADGLPIATPLPYRGSSMLSALAEADCLLEMEAGVDRIEEGRIVDARLLRP